MSTWDLGFKIELGFLISGSIELEIRVFYRVSLRCLLYRVSIVSNGLSSIKSLRFLSSILYLLFYRVSFLHKLSSIS